jgi:hypothetical protein
VVHTGAAANSGISCDDSPAPNRQARIGRQQLSKEGRFAMAALIALVASGLFASGAIAGIVGVVSVAIRREERKFTLTSQAPDNVTRAGRLLNGVYVRAPHRIAAADRQTTSV